uniref:C2H2-type domain-containing protein n=1 Tax=Naja naja TaxID=35670 RepID=A0A8C6Y3L3_NAJNA
MEIQLNCVLESDDCNSRGDQSSEFNSISDWVGHKASPGLKVKEDNLTPFYPNISPVTFSCHEDFSAKLLCGQQEISSKGFPKTSTYWQQQNPCTPGVYVPARLIYNLASQEKDLEYQCFDISKDLHGQREEEEKFIILVDSNEEENISPQLGKTLLQEHRKLHVARNSYHCPLCGKEFFRAANLRMHKLTHTEERPHKCPILCHKVFRKPNLLSKHKVIHRQEKPYKCKECGMAFVQLARLKSMHMYSVLGLGPFCSNYCLNVAWHGSCQPVALLRCYGRPGCFNSGLQLFCIVRSHVSHLSFGNAP